MDIEGLLTYLETFMAKEDIRIKEPMSRHTSFRVGGPAGVFIRVPKEKELKKIIFYLYTHKLPYFILGNGSNLLVADEGYDGVILSLGDAFAQIEVSDTQMRIGASCLLGKAAKEAMEASLSGLEFAAGIPGSVGGGVVMNAGAYGGELSQVVTEVRAMNDQGEVVFLKKEELEMGYRSSIFKRKPYIVLEVTVELKPEKKEEIFARMQEYNRLRQEKQPLEYPSAGSSFKRPKGYFAGKLIMDAGLRGFSVGGAQISEKHCGFVINKNKATATDIRLLMEEVRRQVKQQFGVELEPEVIFLDRAAKAADKEEKIEEK
ncbi:MAG: UDP-N-acetylmuramate dehydrogenase [Lachnospiraceae bacterium]